MTNVRPNELNYDHYSMTKYDEDIVNAIPGHKLLHGHIAKFVSKNVKAGSTILELGVGTGLTTAVVAGSCKNPHFICVDFSKQMMAGAKKRMKGYDCTFILRDFSKMILPQNDVTVSVIGFHHQGPESAKKKMLRKIYGALRPGGFLILGDLMTHDKKEDCAYFDALHFHYLVEHAKNDKTLREWAYHHKYLNPLSSWQSHVQWLKEIGFKNVKVELRQWNTFLMTAIK